MYNYLYNDMYNYLYNDMYNYIYNDMYNYLYNYLYKHIHIWSPPIAVRKAGPSKMNGYSLR